MCSNCCILVVILTLALVFNLVSLKNLNGLLQLEQEQLRRISISLVFKGFHRTVQKLEQNLPSFILSTSI